MIPNQSAEEASTGVFPAVAHEQDSWTEASNQLLRLMMDKVNRVLDRKSVV